MVVDEARRGPWQTSPHQAPPRPAGDSASGARLAAVASEALLPCGATVSSSSTMRSPSCRRSGSTSTRGADSEARGAYGVWQYSESLGT